MLSNFPNALERGRSHSAAISQVLIETLCVKAAHLGANFYTHSKLFIVKSFIMSITKSFRLSVSLVAIFLLLTGKILAQVPTITSFFPVIASSGATVTITGTGFNATASNNVIFLGGIKATVTSASTTQLTVIIPNGVSTTAFLYTNLATNLSCLSPNSFIVKFGSTTPISTSYSTMVTAGIATDVSPGESFDVVDFNNDGKVDFIYQTNGSGALRLQTNSSTSATSLTSSNFTESSLSTWPTSGYGTGPIVLSDFNSDGRIDAFCGYIGYSGSKLLMQSQSGAGTFVQQTYGGTNCNCYQSGVRAIDFNRDGKIDMVGNYFHPSINFYPQTNTSTGGANSITFTMGSATNLDGDAYGGTGVADFDKNGYSDIAVVSTLNSRISVRPNSASGYGATVQLILPSASKDMKVADLNVDGFDDIVTGGSSGVISVFRNTTTSTLSFASRLDITNGSNEFYAIDVVDFNGDDKPDIVGLTTSSVVLFINNSSGSTLSFDGGTVLSSAGDFTYDLKVIDVNNDGIPELIRRTGAGTRINYYVPQPSITVSGTLSAFTQCGSTATTPQTFTVSGSNLTANISFAAVTGFEYSTNNSTWATTLGLVPVSGSVTTTTVYVRMNRSSDGSSSGSISISSSGATTRTVAVSGTRSAAPTITYGSIASVLTAANSFTIPYSSATPTSGLTYSVAAGTNSLTNFTPVVDAAFSGASGNFVIPIPANSTAGTYNFTAIVKNTSTGCQSTASTVNLTIRNPNPNSTVARYVKVEFTGAAGDAGQVNLHEVYAFSSGTNVALNKTATGNNSTGQSSAVDGITSNFNRYSSDRSLFLPSATTPVFVTIDLASLQDIDYIKVYTVGDGGFHCGWNGGYDFKVFTSTDNSTWTQFGTSAVGFIGTWPCAGTSACGVSTPPTITSFTPTSAFPGQTITITGTNLSGINGVRFGSVAATSFTRVSATSITAVIPSNATTGKIAVSTTSFTSQPSPCQTGLQAESATDLTITACPTNAGTLTGTQTICASTSTTFSSTQTGGAWSSNNTAVATVNSSTGEVTGVSAGTAVITYTISGVCATVTSTRGITVNAIPQLSGNQAVSVSGTTTYASTVTGGTWVSSDPTIATINASTGVITGVAVGTATITYTASTGCTAVRSVSVVNCSVGSASSSPTLCINTSLTPITHTTIGVSGVGTGSGLPTGITATWASNTVTLSGTPTQSGTFNYSIPLTGCSGVNATGTITVTAAPNAGTISGTQTICVAGTSQLTATGTGTSGALDFDGIDDQVIGGSSVTTLNITGDITVEGWFKINQLPLDWVRLIGRGTPTSNSTTRPYGLWLATNGTILWQMWGSNENGQILTDIALQTNRWYHIAANRVGTTIKIYIDGVEVKSGTRTNALSTSTSPLTLGYGDMHTYFNGAMDEIRVWNVGRTQSQINEFKNVEISAQTGLVAYYKFNQGTPGSNNSGVTTLTDASGNSLNATLTNFSLSGNSSNWSSRESAGTWSSTNSSIASVGSNGLVTGVAAGTTTITYTVTNTNGCASSTSTSVSVNATSVAGTATTTTNSICSGSTATVSLSGNTGTIQWQSSANGTTWANITNATAASYTSPALTQTTYYRAVVTSGVCAPATSGTVTITVNPTSVAGTATTTAATICSGSTATVSLSGNTGTIQWQSSANGTTWANISGATSSSYTSPALTQTTYYRAVVTSGVCSGVNSGTLTITFYPIPTLTSAGVTTGSISTAGLQIHLDAANTSSYPGTGTAWTDLSGNGRHATLSNSGVTFNSANGGNLVFANGTATSNATHTMNLQSGYTLIQALRLSSYAGGTFQYNRPSDYINYYLGGDGQMRWETYAGNAIRSNATLPLNTWVVVSSTFSGVNTTGATGTAKIYINGVLDNSGTLASSATMPATNYVVGEYAGAMNGAVGATLFYNRELTANEIAQNFNFFASRYSLPAAAAQSALSACSGQVFSYTPTSNVSGATFSWTRAAVTGISNAAASGTGAISETLVNTTSSIVAVNYVYTTTANGCSSSSTISVDVYPTPAPITGTSVLCVGGTSTLSSTTSGGAWTSSNTTVATVSSAGVVTALSAGTATITYALTVGGSCNNLFRTRVVTVDPTSVAGTAAATAAAVCSGSTATVSLSGNTGTIQWQSSANGTTWANITGATAASYTSPALTQTTYYRAVVTSGVCSSVNSGTVTITVNPIATVNAVANQAVCNNSSTTAINFTTTNTGGTTTYAWTNSNTAIGLAASGTGNIAAFTAVNAGAATVSSTITVTPTFSNAGVSCVGTPSTFTITVNPIPTMAALQNQVVCDGSPTTAVAFSSTTAGGTLTYNWINNTPSIGLAATGSGNIASFTAVNTTPNPIAAIITVTPVFTNGGTACSGTARLLAITINPTVIANAIDNQAVCVGGTTLPVTFSTATTEGSVTYNWVNDTPGIGLAASGTGSIAAFTVSNTTNAVITATITVTPTYVNRGVTCIGAPRTFTIAVNPIPSLSTVSNQVLCNGSASDAVNFSSPATGGVLTYSWTNSNAAIGLAASGTGSIAAFTVSNTTTAPISATITVTPTLTNGGTACTGAPGSFTIAVNPAVIMNAVTSQVVCNGSTTAAVNFATTLTGGTTTYSWSSDNDAIGLAASGTGNIAAFTASNTTTAPIVATITVTPTFTAGALSCTGASRTFTITVNPTATVTSVNNQVLCNGATTAAVDFASPTTGGTIVYNWTNSAASIGLAASGTGTIAAFSAVNTGTAPVVATISVRPTFTNGSVSCLGTTSTFTITVNPTAVMNTVANRVFCNGATTAAINFATTNTVGTTTYSWTNDNTAIGLDASGTGNIGAFSAVNTGTAPVVATITVTPTFTNGGVSCEGTPRTFTITINPTAVAGAVSNQLLCSGTATTAVNFTSNITAGSVSYSWTNSAPTIGLAASGTGNIASFTALNTGTAPVVATITVTPSVTTGTTTCAGTSRTFTITVNPAGAVSAVSNQAICNGANSSAVNFATTATAGTTTYSWTNTNTAIGLAASGTGNIASFTGVNTGSAPAVATISVTPTLASGGISCVGSVRSFTITVNPTPAVNAVSNVAVCNGATTSGISFTSSNTGGTVTYSWTNNNTAIGLAASGTGSIASFVASNTSADPIVATITVTPSFTLGAATCVGTPRTFTITVNPTPVVTATDLFNRRLCVSDQPFALVGTPSGGVWSGAGVSGGAQLNPGSLAAGGNYVLTYTFTSAAGCVASDTTSVKVFLCEERYRMLEEGGVNIYPNPTTGRFNLQVTSTRFESMEMAVYSKEGRFITLKRWPKVVFGQVLPIDLSHLPSGLYTIKVRAANIYQPSSFEVGGFKLNIIR